MAPGEIRALARPLSRLTKSGTPYSRPPEVESQLETLLRANAQEQLARAKIKDKDSPKFVKDECLVYLIHEAWLADDSGRFSELTGQLLRRCAPSIRRSLRALGVSFADIDEIYDQIVTAMTIAILSRDAGEFYQVRFRRAIRFLTIKLYAQYANRCEQTQGEVSLSAPIAGDEAGEDGATLEERIAAPEDVVRDTEQRLIIREALAAIRDARHRQVFVLHHYDDWPLESADPADPSISRHFGVTSRTVRNWLRAAERDLAAWRETQGA